MQVYRRNLGDHSEKNADKEEARRLDWGNVVCNKKLEGKE